MIIDFHTHTFPDKIAARAVEKLKNASHTAAFSDGTAAGLCASMRRAGIDRSVVLPVATNPEKVASINDVSAEANGQNGLTFFACMHPEYGDWKQELARIKSLGFKGIKLHPVYQGVDFDDVRTLRILDRAAEVGLITVTHSGDDIGFPGVTRISPDMVLRARKQTDGGTWVLAHMGGWRFWDRLDELFGLGLYADTSFSLGDLTPIDNHYTPEELKMLKDGAFVKLVRAFGADRVLFGTDSPWAEQTTYLKKIQALPLTEDEKEKILWRNALTLLGE